MSAAAKRVESYELENAKFMKVEFEKALDAVTHGKRINESRRNLYERVVRNVKTAKNSVERKANLTPRRKAAELKSRFERIRNTLRNNRNYSMGFSNTGNVRKPIPVSFVNIIFRKTVIDEVDSAKDFKTQPGASILFKNANPPPVEWRETNALISKHAKISTKILDGSIGKWKEGKLIKKGVSVIVRVEAGKHIILGAFKKYDAAAIAAHPDLKFCDEGYWKEHEVFKDI
jgi:hypothetical protein